MRLRRVPGMDGTRYSHPNGWLISPEVRDWDARSTGPGGRGFAEGPKQTWTVRVARSTSRRRWGGFPTLREARAWCDSRQPYQLLKEGE